MAAGDVLTTVCQQFLVPCGHDLRGLDSIDQYISCSLNR